MASLIGLYRPVYMPMVAPELLAPIAFVVGILFGLVVMYIPAKKRGYDEGLEDGRSGR